MTLLMYQEQLQQTTAELQQRDTQIQQQATIIQQKDAQIQQKEEELRQSTVEFQQKSFEFNSVQQSLQVLFYRAYSCSSIGCDYYSLSLHSASAC